jgi:subtilisin-like proprotein convertase family protein
MDRVAAFGSTPEIVDNARVQSNIFMGNRGRIEDVDISLNIAHSAMGQLKIFVRSPSGTLLTLMDGVGGNFDNMNTTVFDDEAARSITDSGVRPPFGGRLRPAEALSAFDGEDIRGTEGHGQWIVFFEDSASGDQGLVNRVILSIKTEAGTVDRVEPFQASYDLFITRADGSEILLLNDGSGFFTNASNRLPPRTGPADPSYDAAVGNVYLRSRREQHGPVDIDRPMVDIVVGLDTPVATSNGVRLLLNNLNNPGNFLDVSYEVPRNRAILQNPSTQAAQDLISGNIRTVKLVDGDRDGDLDLFLGQAGRLGTTFVGATDWFYVNRVIGDNELIQTRSPLFDHRAPRRFRWSRPFRPRRAAWATTLSVQVFGLHLANGARLDFGQGVEVVNYGAVLNGKMLVRLRVDPDAILGPRSVDVIDPMGARHESDLAVFYVRETSEPAGAAAMGWEAYE